MKKFSKFLAVALAGTMLFSLAACTKPATTPTPAVSEAAPATSDAAAAPADAAPTSDLTLKVFNSKGENAEQFAAMCAAFTAETGIKTEVFSVGSGQDHQEPLRADMASKNPPAVFAVQGLKELPEWKTGGLILDLSQSTDPTFKALADAIPANLRLTDDNVASYGVPYNIEGYGYIVDKQMLADLFGPTLVDSVLRDIGRATYAEWEALVKAIDAYIKTPTAAKVMLDKKEYTLVAEKTGLAKNLNGVFSVMGSQKWTYGDHFVNVALNAAFANASEAALADDAKIDSLGTIFEKYAQGLDFKTSYLAGLNGPAKRGPDFVSEANFGYDQGIQIFADSKAVFIKQGNWAYGNIEKLNPDMAARLTFLPVKLPIEASDIQVDGLTVDHFNSSIPVYVPNFYAINAKVSPELQKAAMDFLVWVNESETGKKFVVEQFNYIPYNADPATTTLPNSLGNSILSYLSAGNNLAAPYHGAPGPWSGDTFGLRIMEEFMVREEWTSADYKDISIYARETWKELARQ